MALALLAIGLAESILPPRPAGHAVTALCGLGVVLALASLQWGGGALALGPLRAAVDGLSGWMLLPLLLGAAGGVRGAAVLGVAMLAILAADAATSGLAVAGFAATARRRPPALLAWAGCTVLALLVLALGGGLGFPAMRAAPPGLILAGAVLVLSVAGIAALAWAPPAPTLAVLAPYMLARLLLDLCGPALPLAFGLPVLAAGLLAAVCGGVRLMTAQAIEDAASAGLLAQSGLACAGLGAALAARGADLSPMAALALSGSMLLLLSGTLAAALLRLCGGGVQQAAGTTQLDRLGGLLPRMPAMAGGLLLATAVLAAMPPFAGFAGLFLLVQALLAGPRLGGLSVQLGFTLALALAGLAWAALAGGAVRLAGLALLGPPRTGRAETACDPPLLQQAGLAGLAALTLLLGLWPGLPLLLAWPALRQLVGAELAELPVYLPAVLALAVAALGGLVAVVLRLSPAPAARTSPVWQGAPDSASYAAGCLAALPGLPRLRAPSLREVLGLVLLVLLAALIALAAR